MKKATCFILVICIVFTSAILLDGKIARAASVYPIIEAENYNTVSGAPTKVANYASNGGNHLINVNSGNSLTFNNVDFMSGAVTLQVRVATPRDGGTMEVHLGGATGTLLTTLSIPNTHAWTNNLGIDWSNGWRTATAPITNAPTGVQTITLVFKNPAGGRVADVDWFRLLSAPTPTTYYVAPSGNDSNNGAASSPFKTITKGMTKLLPGDTLEIAGGTYNEQVHIKSIYSGTAQNRTTIRAAAGQRVIVTGAGLTTNPVVNLRADYINVDGLEITGSSNMGISGDGDFMILQNLKVHDNQGTGIGVWDSDGTLIQKNEFWNNVQNNTPLGSNSGGGWGAGLIAYHSYNIKIDNNFSHDNAGEGIIAGTDSFYMTVTNNLVRDNWSVGIYLGGSHFSVVERNLVWDTETSYIPMSSPVSRSLATAFGTTDEDYSSWSPPGVWGCGTPGYIPAQGNTWRNNIAVNTRIGFAYTYQEISCSGLINDVIENNTFVNIWQDAVKLAPGAHSGSVFRNNIFHSKGSSDSTRVLIAQDRNNTQFENNLFWTADNSAAGKFVWQTDEAYSPKVDFNTWSAADHVSNNFWGNPNLTALGSLTGDIAANHKLTANSMQAIDKGTTVGAPNVDYWAMARPAGATIDIGAAEFGGNVAQPTNTAVPPTSTSVPPTATNVPPTATFVPPTATNVPPTATFVPPTPTKVPSTATSLPTTVPSASQIKVQYLPGNTNASSNQLQPRFKIVNTSATSLSMSQFTLRYYFTQDGTAPLAFTCQNALLGCGKVLGRFTPVSTPATNATYYLEVSFTSGTLPAGGDSGEIWTRINKNDWSAFNQTNDYSYGSTVKAYTDWTKLTLYRNGVLIWGNLPGVTPATPNPTVIAPTIASVPGLRMQYRTLDTNPTDTQIRPQFSLNNDSTSDIPLSQVSFRYYFTSEGNQSLQFSCDYADVNCANVTAKFVPISPTLTGANTYLEITFTAAAGNLAAGANTVLLTRINKADWSTFNENDDYSVDFTKTAYANWTRVTVYLNGTLKWGTLPSSTPQIAPTFVPTS